MSKKIEDFFNLEPSDDEEAYSPREYTLDDKKELMATANAIYSESLTAMEKIDIALPTITDMSEHDLEMDDIAKKAIGSFQDMMSLGGNVTDMHAGKIYEVASTMLKTALDAKNSKAEKKLRIIELQIKKARLDQISQLESGEGGQSRGGEFDRNELMKHITEASKADKSPETDK